MLMSLILTKLGRLAGRVARAQQGVAAIMKKILAKSNILWLELETPVVITLQEFLVLSFTLSHIAELNKV
jgi:hypothetical protein